MWPGSRVFLALVLAAAMAAVATAGTAAAGPGGGDDGPVVVDDGGLAITNPSVDKASTPGASAAAASAAACIGNGTAGNRVQLMYVRRVDQPSRLTEIAPQMRAWAMQIDRMFLFAARETGGFRRVRWVTGADCLPTVLEHAVPADTPGFGEMLVDLAAHGYRPTNRKLLIAANFGGYCGFGEVEPDDRPGPENFNNTQQQGLAGAVDEICWGFPAAAHELVHTLGAVQVSAPNATPGRHCTDDADLMCYFDGSSPDPVREVCPRIREEYLDCGYDDYFNVSPAAGSYLASHWNIANSSFLDRAQWFLPPERPENPRVTMGTASATLTWDPPIFDGGSPVTGYVVTAFPTGKTVTVGGSARTTTVTGLADGEAVSFSVQSTSAYGVSIPSIQTDLRTPTPTIRNRARFTTADDPAGVAADKAGNIYVGTSQGLVKVAPNGARTRIASSAGKVLNPPKEGTPVATTPVLPAGIAIHPKTGDVYFVDRSTQRIRRISGGRVYTFAGGSTRFVPDQIAFDSKGNLYITEPTKNRVWKRTTDGKLNILAGSATGTAGYSGDGGAARAALLRAPSGVAVDRAGNVYIADENNHRVRRVTPNGIIDHWLGNGANVVVPAIFDGTSAEFALLPHPQGITWGNGRLFVQSGARVLAVTPDRLHVTYAGFPGTSGDSGDGGPAHRALIGDNALLAMAGARLVVLDLNFDHLRQIDAPHPAVP